MDFLSKLGLNDVQISTRHNLKNCFGFMMGDDLRGHRGQQISSNSFHGI